ncbi:MAG: energy transducer TonB [Bacteroidota bacterium]|uniref:TonB family protein n=1 Tax=Christiangramia flava JLT2011 TaxID=1229726 RepID=A0A1L7I791_9FLAO|nr:energy transducer TonB [Christiangramia flava]APU69467.1 TonB family protein [Christiangramia flava JLT2011]MAM19918.1 energy transducer TonB [Christiangramia sp.]MEE2771717.1 energy transducer TonB [Bacteroidota bacterium]OSS37932.1 TonB family protein [Christiangramia flava JLT2011]
MLPKKNPKADLSRNSLIFFQIGLIVMLGISYLAIEWHFDSRPAVDLQQLDMETERIVDVPVTELREKLPPPPPPPPAPEVIEVIEDNSVLEESTIQSTETNLNDKIEVVEVTDIKEEKIAEEIEDVPFVIIANVPVYPGCENQKGNDAKKQCMSGKIQELVKREFRTELSAELGLKGINKIYVIFRINDKGDVENIQARGPHPALEAEAERVVKLIPKMEPGRQRDRAVGVLYTLPIIFEVRNQSI